MSHAAKVLTHRALRRRHFIGLIVLATILLWTGVWMVAAYYFNKSMDKLIADARAKGVVVQFSERHTGGTPISVDIKLDSFAVETKTGSKVKASEAVFYFDLWQWSAISAKLRDGIEGTFAGVPFTAAILKFGFEVPEREPINYREVGLFFWVQPFSLNLTTEKPLAFGNTIPEGLFSMRVMGPVPDFSNKDSVAAWNEASGVIEFDRFFLHWGPTTVTANGTVGLDSNLQPEGAFSGRIEGLDEAVDMLSEQGTITKRQESLLRSSLSVLSRPSGMTGSSAPIVPVSIQSGGLYLGPVRLMKLPEVNW